jgi:hypothetical protein
MAGETRNTCGPSEAFIAATCSWSFSLSSPPSALVSSAVVSFSSFAGLFFEWALALTFLFLILFWLSVISWRSLGHIVSRHGSGSKGLVCLLHVSHLLVIAGIPGASSEQCCIRLCQSLLTREFPKVCIPCRLFHVCFDFRLVFFQQLPSTHINFYCFCSIVHIAGKDVGLVNCP